MGGKYLRHSRLTPEQTFIAVTHNTVVLMCCGPELIPTQHRPRVFSHITETT